MGIRNASSTDIVLLLALLNTLAVFAAEKSVCSLPYFGLPDLQACNSLLFSSGTPGHRGIVHIDAADHAFLLPGFAEASEFTEEQWTYKIYLPQVFSNRRYPLPLIVGGPRDLRLT